MKSLEIDAKRNIVVEGSTGLLLLQICVSITLLQQHLAILHNQHRGSGYVRAFQLQGHDSIEERLQIRRFECVLRRRICVYAGLPHMRWSSWRRGRDRRLRAAKKRIEKKQAETNETIQGESSRYQGREDSIRVKPIGDSW